MAEEVNRNDQFAGLEVFTWACVDTVYIGSVEQSQRLHGR